MLEDLTSGLRPLGPRDLRSQLTGNRSLGSLTQESWASIFDARGRNRPASSEAGLQPMWSSFPFISVCFRLPLSLPLPIFLSFPGTPVRHSPIHLCIQFGLCLGNPFSPPLALGNLSSVFCHYSFGFLGMSYKWHYRTCSPGCPASFI